MAETGFTTEEPMSVAAQEVPAPHKSGTSEDGSPSKAAQEILTALEEGLGNSPEAIKVKDLVKKLEETLQEELKKKAPGSSASSNAGSYVVLGAEDDPMKPKSPRTKKSTLGSGSRVPTPEGKRKHEGPLRERLEMKDWESVSPADLELLLESLKEQEKSRSHEAEETKRRKSDDEKAKLAKDENSSLRRTVEELQEREKQVSALYELNVEGHKEEIAKWAQARATLEAQHQVDMSRMAENNALERKSLDENKAHIDASRIQLQHVNEALKQEEFAVSEKNKALNRFKDDQHEFFIKSDNQRTELADTNFVLSQVQRKLEIAEAAEASVRSQLTSSRERENGFLGEAQRNTAKIYQLRDEFEGTKAVLQQEQATAVNYHQTAIGYSNAARQEESRVVNLAQELTSEQFAYRKHTQIIEADAGTNSAALLKLRESQIEQMTQAHLNETHNLTKQRNDAVLKIQSLEDTVRSLTTREQTAKQEAQSAEERAHAVHATLCARDQELQNMVGQLAQAQSLASIVQQLNLENQNLKEKIRLFEQQHQKAFEDREATITQDWYHFESTLSEAHRKAMDQFQKEIDRLKAESASLAAGGTGGRDGDDGKRPERLPRSRHDDASPHEEKKKKKKRDRKGRSRSDSPIHVQISTPREAAESQTTVKFLGLSSDGPKLEFGPARTEFWATTQKSQETQGSQVPITRIDDSKGGRDDHRRQRESGGPDDGGDDSDSSSSDSDSSSDGGGDDSDDSDDDRRSASSGNQTGSGGDSLVRGEEAATLRGFIQGKRNTGKDWKNMQRKFTSTRRGRLFVKKRRSTPSLRCQTS